MYIQDELRRITQVVIDNEDSFIEMFIRKRDYDSCSFQGFMMDADDIRVCTLWEKCGMETDYVDATDFLLWIELNTPKITTTGDK